MLSKKCETSSRFVLHRSECMDDFERYSLESENQRLAAQVLRLEEEIRRLKHEKLIAQDDLDYAHQKLRDGRW